MHLYLITICLQVKLYCCIAYVRLHKSLFPLPLPLSCLLLKHVIDPKYIDIIFCFKYSTIFEENFNNENTFTHVFSNFHESIFYVELDERTSFSISVSIGNNYFLIIGYAGNYYFLIISYYLSKNIFPLLLNVLFIACKLL